MQKKKKTYAARTETTTSPRDSGPAQSSLQDRRIRHIWRDAVVSLVCGVC